MGNCLQSLTGKNRKSISVLIVGLDNAGKTTAAKRVQGSTIENVAPTIGYSSEIFKFGKFDVTMVDVGGGKRIRDIWKNYFAEVHAIIYVVDSSNHERMEESRDELTQLLSNPLIHEKPILLFANKQDKEGALDEVDIGERLNLEAIVNEYKCFCKVVTCAAILNKKDQSMKNGMRWLLGEVEKKFDKLNSRVQADVKTRDAELKLEMEARRERVRRRREEREAQENANHSPATGENIEQSGNGITDRKNNLPLATVAFSNGPSLQSPPSVTPSHSARSGLGDELLDDDSDVNLPGSVQQSQVELRREDYDSTNRWNNNSRISDIVRDTPSTYSDEDGATPAKVKKKAKRSNKVLPLNDQVEHPNAIKLAPLKVPGKLPPLGSGENSDIEGKMSDSAPGAVRLPPLQLSKPNADDDVLV